MYTHSDTSCQMELYKHDCGCAALYEGKVSGGGWHGCDIDRATSRKQPWSIQRITIHKDNANYMLSCLLAVQVRRWQLRSLQTPIGIYRRLSAAFLSTVRTYDHNPNVLRPNVSHVSKDECDCQNRSRDT